MNILFYTVSYKRSRDIESQALEFNAKGHQVFLLTQTKKSELHEFFEDHSFIAESEIFDRVPFVVFVYNHAKALVRFCNRYKIDIVYSHLDTNNLVAVLSQYFSKAKFIICRHHADAVVFESNKKGQLLSRLIYTLARTIIVVSRNSKQFMVNRERISPNKIHIIPLSFDFALFKIPHPGEVQLIKEKYPCSLLIATVGRIVPLKRMDKIIDLVKLLIGEGIDTKLLILGIGPEEDILRKKTSSLKLDTNVFFLGFISDVLPYLNASDVYVHFSATEASCTTVKEAALVSTPVIVCRGVGDFEEYVEDKVSGWLVDLQNCVQEAANILKGNYNNKGLLQRYGDNLRKVVINRFNIKNVISQYEKFHKFRRPD